MRRFELSEGKANKFWEISLENDSFTVRYGRIGTGGQTQTKSFASEEKAAAEAEKLIREKTGKGYAEVNSVHAVVAPQPAPAAPPAAPPPRPVAAVATPARAVVEESPAPQQVPPAPRAATVDALPRVLLNPPWLTKKPPRTQTVVKVAPLDRPHSFAWAKGEREQYAERYGWVKPEDSAEFFADMRRKVAEHGERVSPHIDSWWCTVRLTDELLQTAWNEFPFVVWRSNTALYLLARLGDGCLPKYIDYALSLRQPTTTSALVPVVSTAVAPIMADGYAGRRSRKDAERWLRAHPEIAAVGLIPVAVGDGKGRENAGAALRLLVTKGHGEIVRTVAAEYGAEVQAAVTEVLAVDPADTFPSKLPKLPSFFDPETLPRPCLASGEALPSSAVVHLATMLAFSSPDAPYGGIAQVKEACDARSLDEFAWGLFEAWSKAGAPSKEQWALLSIGYVGGDGSARKLTPLIRSWPGQGLHARAVLGLDVLAAVGSDIALMNLHGIAQKVKFKALQDRAQEKIVEIAETRGLSVDELADRLVPDLDLDDDGSKVLDFGARQFRVGFDEALRPLVRDATGARLADLPKPNKSDDAAKAKSAVETWKLLRKDAKQVASGQILRLEMAMCAARRWDAATFRTFLLDHPLVRHLSRRLVWGLYDTQGALTDTFRVAEDGTLASIDDTTWSLPEHGSVGIPHVLSLDAKLVAAWGERFGEYEILPPFPQLARETFTPTEDEAASTSLSRWDGLKVPTGKVIALLGRGWLKGPPQDAGWIWEWLKPLPGCDEPATLHLQTGVLAAGMSEEPTQELGSLSLPVPGGQLLPVVFSELVRDLESVRE